MSIKTVSIRTTFPQAAAVYCMVLQNGNQEGREEARKAIMEMSQYCEHLEQRVKLLEGVIASNRYTQNHLNRIEQEATAEAEQLLKKTAHGIF